MAFWFSEAANSHAGHANVLHPASLVELSPMGLRIALPLRMRRRQTFQIEIELPGVDEIIWARGSVASRGRSRASGACCATT